MEKIIIKHIKDKRRRYIGTFVAIPSENGKDAIIGWSKCHRLDKEKNRLNKISSKKKGLTIAMTRAEKGTKKPLAFTLADEMLKFIERISRYYKGKNIISPIMCTMDEWYNNQMGQ